MRASRSRRARRSGSVVTACGSVLIATSRPRRVSRARYTSPIPPAPMRAAITYEPRRVPSVSGMEGAASYVISLPFALCLGSDHERYNRPPPCSARQSLTTKSIVRIKAVSVDRSGLIGPDSPSAGEASVFASRWKRARRSGSRANGSGGFAGDVAAELRVSRPEHFTHAAGSTCTADLYGPKRPSAVMVTEDCSR